MRFLMISVVRQQSAHGYAQANFQKALFKKCLWTKLLFGDVRTEVSTRDKRIYIPERLNTMSRCAKREIKDKLEIIDGQIVLDVVLSF